MTSPRRDLLGSPNFQYENTASLAAGAETVFDFAKRAETSEKYAPFNFLTVTNNSSAKIKIYINQDDGRAFLIPANTIRSFDSKSIPALYSLRVKNASSATTIAAEELTFEVQKEVADTDNLVQRGVRKLFGGFGI